MVAFIVKMPNERPLLVRRDDPELSGGESRRGTCGALIDGRSTPSRAGTPGHRRGATFATVEGLLGADGTLSRAQQAWLDEQATQRAFRRPGVRTAARAPF